MLYYIAHNIHHIWGPTSFALLGAFISGLNVALTGGMLAVRPPVKGHATSDRMATIAFIASTVGLVALSPTLNSLAHDYVVPQKAQDKPIAMPASSPPITLKDTSTKHPDFGTDVIAHAFHGDGTVVYAPSTGSDPPVVLGNSGKGRSSRRSSSSRNRKAGSSSDNTPGNAPAGDPTPPGGGPRRSSRLAGGKPETPAKPLVIRKKKAKTGGDPPPPPPPPPGSAHEVDDDRNGVGRSSHLPEIYLGALLVGLAVLGAFQKRSILCDINRELFTLPIEDEEHSVEVVGSSPVEARNSLKVMDATAPVHSSSSLTSWNAAAPRTYWDEKLTDTVRAPVSPNVIAFPGTPIYPHNLFFQTPILQLHGNALINETCDGVCCSGVTFSTSMKEAVGVMVAAAAGSSFPQEQSGHTSIRKVITRILVVFLSIIVGYLVMIDECIEWGGVVWERQLRVAHGRREVIAKNEDDGELDPSIEVAANKSSESGTSCSMPEGEDTSKAIPRCNAASEVQPVEKIFVSEAGVCNAIPPPLEQTIINIQVMGKHSTPDMNPVLRNVASQDTVQVKRVNDMLVIQLVIQSIDSSSRNLFVSPISSDGDELQPMVNVNPPYRDHTDRGCLFASPVSEDTVEEAITQSGDADDTEAFVYPIPAVEVGQVAVESEDTEISEVFVYPGAVSSVEVDQPNNQSVHADNSDVFIYPGFVEVEQLAIQPDDPEERDSYVFIYPGFRDAMAIEAGVAETETLDTGKKTGRTEDEVIIAAPGYASLTAGVHEGVHFDLPQMSAGSQAVAALEDNTAEVPADEPVFVAVPGYRRQRARPKRRGKGIAKTVNGSA